MKEESTTKDQYTIVLEGVNDKLGLLVDGQVGLNNRMKKIEVSVKTIKDDVGEIKHDLRQKADLKDLQTLEKKFIALKRFVLEKVK